MLRFERDMNIHKYNLVELQNHSVNQDQDHLTICAFFQEEEQFQILASKLKVGTLSQSSLHCHSFS